jgi:hypothetical protein
MGPSHVLTLVKDREASARADAGFLAKGGLSEVDDSRRVYPPDGGYV